MLGFYLYLSIYLGSSNVRCRVIFHARLFGILKLKKMVLQRRAA